jgi:hypothetical protein
MAKPSRKDNIISQRRKAIRCDVNQRRRATHSHTTQFYVQDYSLQLPAEYPIIYDS